MIDKASCILSIDAMGGDDAPGIVIGGLALEVIRQPNVRYLLHGDEARIAPLVEAHPALKKACRIVHTPDVVAMDDKPSHVLRGGRNRGRTTSMWKAIAAVKVGEAHAAVSAGNTGALMAMAKLQLKAMEGIERPAIAAIWPTIRGESIVLDVGANVGLDERQLVDFAILGETYARVIFGIERPSVALLNIGAEEVKGTEAVKAAAADIRESGMDMNFEGFVEGVDIGLGKVDVVVTDGFTGNVAIKTAEGTARLILHHLSAAMRRSWLSRLGALLASGAFRTLRERLDPRASNGGVFLGLNGIVVKSHGGTDAMGFASALDLAIDLAGSDIEAKIKARLAEIKDHRPPTALERLEAHHSHPEAVHP